MRHRRLLTMAIALATAAFAAAPAVGANADEAEGVFQQTNLVSDLPGIAANLDPNLVNPWGISAGPTPMWVSDNNAGVTTVYDGGGHAIQVGPPAFPAGPLVVNIPKPGSPVQPAAGAPTGTVFNGTSDFHGDRFLFATEDGTIVGWQFSDVEQARIEADRSTVGAGAVYKGLAIGNNGTANFLYAANFRFGTIDVFDTNFNLVTLDGSFTDKRIPAGFAPFNVQNLGDRLYVTYAFQKPDKHDDLSGPGNGFVDVYDLNGHLMRRLVRHGALNSPWGLAIAPAGFGEFGGDLLVGNFGDGRINVYSPRSGHLRGTLRGANEVPISISGLWGLRFGNGVAGASPNTLYFTAGIEEETHGLFGSIVSVGEGDD